MPLSFAHVYFFERDMNVNFSNIQLIILKEFFSKLRPEAIALYKQTYKRLIHGPTASTVNFVQHVHATLCDVHTNCV